MPPIARFPINYSCYFSESREGEQFVGMHGLGMVVSGSMEFNDGETTVTFRPGDPYFVRRNRLLKFNKRPSDKEEYRSISIAFDDQTLKDFSLKHSIHPDKKTEGSAFVGLQADELLTGFLTSLIPYESLTDDPSAAPLLHLKQDEALLMLLRHDPSLKNILFDFSVPDRIDLEAFMEKNFHFNVSLERFSYLTGRSLSTFKRDFEKLYGQTPSRWLLHRRLKEAHYLIAHKGMNASDIYLDLGFEDLSHFSYAFKKQFGTAPSRIAAH
jgi:AraC-like DNA-binding protein